VLAASNEELDTTKESKEASSLDFNSVFVLL
ncbi:uncharacterized protein METZ01_LOCUS419347, partial [marine metagenome]